MKIIVHRIARFSVAIRLLLFVLMLAGIGLPIAGLLSIAIQDSNTLNIVTMATLFLVFIFLVHLWGRWVHQHPWIIQRYGLILTRQNGMELGEGIILGCISLIGVFVSQGILGWLLWQPGSVNWARIVLEGGVVALTVGCAEELLFRGFLLDELERDYPAVTGLWVSSIIYAALHFVRPLEEILRTFPQFPGLVLLGLILVWAKRSHNGQLGFPIGLHTGLVWSYYIIDVGNLVKYSNRVPEWISGIDQNPLAGVTGLIFLTILAILVRWPPEQPQWK